MDRGTVLLQGVRVKLQPWFAWIKKATHATEVLFEPSERGEFFLVVRWKNKDGVSGEYKKSFTREYVFGRTLPLAPAAWSVQRCAGEHARDTAREVLAKRGV